MDQPTQGLRRDGISWLRVAVLAVIGTIGLFVLVSVVVPLGMMTLVFGGCVLPRSDTFDAGAWRSDDGLGTCTARGPMAADLMANHLPSGMTRTEVLDVLGPPDGDRSWQGEAAYPISCWIDCEWVIVEFDRADRLTRTYQYQD